MREILFRGKRADNGVWVEGADIMHKTVRGELCIADVGTDWVSVIHETVGQYTGLKDKNGKKIFEGDIVTNMLNCDVGIVFYDDELCGFYKTSTRYSGVFGCGILIMCGQEEYEIIGNIHDNPELLEGGE